MTERRQHGRFSWNELATPDPKAAMAFYAKTLGWSFEEFALPDGAYWVGKAGETLVGGIGGMDTAAIGGAEPNWFAFIEVDDVDERIAAARRAGATILREPHDVPGVGRIAVLRDPTSAAVGWMTGVYPD
jgi:uncharacterized protein